MGWVEEVLAVLEGIEVSFPFPRIERVEASSRNCPCVSYESPGNKFKTRGVILMHFRRRFSSNLVLLDGTP